MLGSYSLLCYTRKPTKREEANNADIALSMHLALRSQTNGKWIPLNENYGIFFAAGVPSNAARDASNSSSAHALDALSAAKRSDMDVFDDGREASPAISEGAAMPEVDVVLKSLKDPYLFRLADGSFGIAATRTAREGKADSSERSSFLLAVSKNLTSFDRFAQVLLDTTTGVHHPQVRYDEPTEQYVIAWKDDTGVVHSAHVENILAESQSPLPVDEHTPQAIVELVEANERTAASLNETCGIDDVVAGNVITVTAEEAEALVRRFGRIYNTGSCVRPCTLGASLTGSHAADAVAALSDVRAELKYSDGSTALRAVDWNKAQLAALAEKASQSGLAAGSKHTVTGRIKQTTYPVPFAVERADPSVFAWEFNSEPLFLFIATEDADGNCIDPRDGRTHMPLRVAKSIEELSDAAGGREREIDLLVRGDLNTEGRVMTGCFWAPELHVIDGRLSILFMPCFDGEATNPDGTPNERAGKPDMWTGSCHIMQLKQDDQGNDLDPRDAANWSVPEPILRFDSSALNPVQRISLDMTVIADSGNWYYAWQQVGSVWIARFDPKHPARLTSDPKQIIVPEFAWDNAIAEGPNAIVHDGTIFLIYSGSLVGIDYTTGVVTAPADQHVDLTDPAVWTKLDYPLQKSGIFNNEWQLGTGHGMWSHDEDGNLIYVFHNAEYGNGRYGGRDAQVRRVHWSAENMPILDMQRDEELDPAYADVTMEITVR